MSCSAQHQRSERSLATEPETKSKPKLKTEPKTLPKPKSKHSPSAFQESTRTHCGVANFLPSISSVVGAYQPEMFIWRLCIALHCLPR